MYNKLKNMVPHKIKVNDFVAKLLSKEDIPAIQKFFNDNPDFFIASTGQAPKENEAELLFNKIPYEIFNNKKTDVSPFFYIFKFCLDGLRYIQPANLTCDFCRRLQTHS